MGNNYFQFKQFRIDQVHSDMKVTTDACLFGAWAARQIQNRQKQQILDIGAGTGLLSLMLAQGKNESVITAIEVNDAAAHECRDNFDRSAFTDRLQLIHADYLPWIPPHNSYDLVVSNPPFHKNQLPSPGSGRRLAHHEVGLPLDSLLAKSYALSKADGELMLLLPQYRENEVKRIARESGWHPWQCVTVFPAENKTAFRQFWCFGKQSAEGTGEATIIIKNKEGQYTREFSDYLKEFYLFL